VGCIHADASWCFLSAKGFKIHLGVVQKSFGNFPDFSEIYSHFPSSYFYLLEGSKIFRLSSKYFIWIVRVPMCLWKFSWNFCDFLFIFRAVK
jgi:hypothetical protein